MPRYFFHVQDGVDHRDRDGLTFETTGEARSQALRAASEFLRDASLEPWAGGAWSMEVRDEHGASVLRLMVSAKT